MRAFISALVMLTALFLSPLRATAQGWVDQPFDPAPMSREDIATLQAALAFTADYYGFTDGIWNNDAQAALEAWVKREEGASQPTYRHLTRLIMNLEDERVRNGWQLFYSETTNTSYLHPFELLKDVENKDAVEFLSSDSGFSVMVRFNDQAGMQEVHDWFYGQAVTGKEPYRYTDNNLWITSASLDDDMVAYARSDLYNGSWSTLSIVVWPEYFNHLNLMAASMTVGGSPASLMWTDGGVIQQVINGQTTAAAAPTPADPSDPKDQVRRPLPAGVAEAPEPEPLPEPSPEPGPGPDPIEVAGASPGPAAPILGSPGPGAAPADPGAGAAPGPSPDPGPAVIGVGNPGPAPVRAPGSGTPAPAEPAGNPTPNPEPAAPRPKVTGTLMSSGTGFYITPTMLVTAAHVVDGCGAVAMIDGTPLDIVASDSSLDLAVLSGATDTGHWLKLSALEVPKLGEAVTALGYPYYTSLDQGLTVTSGNVSALRGIDGSSNRVMVTAPVQPGNSGGPLLNKKGAVIGVVVSRVDDMAILEETGSLPQNMNFAVPSGPLLTFLAQSRVTRPQGEGTGGDISGEVPDGVANAVVPLYCYQ